MAQVFYREGKREGECKSWYENGQLWEQEFYRDGEREGKRKYWYENGQFYAQEFYRDGKLIDSGDGIEKSTLIWTKRKIKNIYILDSFIISDLARIICP